VARAAVAQHDRLDERGPAQVVDVVERRAGADQLAHDRVVAEVRRGDQRRAVVAARHVGRAIAERERHLHRLDVVGDRRDRDRVVAVRVERVGVGARGDQRAHRVVPLRERGDVERVRPCASRASTFAPAAACERTAAASPACAAANKPVYAARSDADGGTWADAERVAARTSETMRVMSDSGMRASARLARSLLCR
jgi:hypothetical protein